MEKTVTILSEELCSMSLAFEKAGFRILAACESDKKSRDIYINNIKSVKVYENINNIDIYSLPNSDIIAGKIEVHDWKKNTNNNRLNKENSTRKFIEVVVRKKPKIILCEVNLNAINTEFFGTIISELSNFYNITYNVYKVNELVNIPVNEQKLYVIGVQNNLFKDFNFINDGYSKINKKDILDYNNVDEWYFNVNQNEIKRKYTHNQIGDVQFFCWKSKEYIECELISWNTVKVPLIKINGKVRKITHREIARLKGYPEKFCFNVKNKVWLYSKLMYASNIHLLLLIIRSIENILYDRTLMNYQVPSSIRFEELFRQYLENYFNLENDYEYSDRGYDFIAEKNNLKLCFELKMYANRVVKYANVIKVCERLSIESKLGEKVILVWANEINEQTKQFVKDNYDIEIWDIGNILYIFQEFPEIYNEFIILLNYTIDDIKIKSPDFYIVEEIINENVEDIQQKKLLEKLDKIIPGKENSKLYEKICTDILKVVFGEYLSLFREQQKSNNGLYRFDLCCKIKHGNNHEFFDTLISFFNTKYIVFEFKNLNDLITQSEIYTTEKYLYKTALRCVAIIISRNGANNNALIAAKGCLRENGKLILCLSDKDLHNLINLKITGEKPTPEVLMDMLDDMLINLEK